MRGEYGTCVIGAAVVKGYNGVREGTGFVQPGRQVGRDVARRKKADEIRRWNWAPAQPQTTETTSLLSVLSLGSPGAPPPPPLFPGPPAPPVVPEPPAPAEDWLLP